MQLSPPKFCESRNVVALVEAARRRLTAVLANGSVRQIVRHIWALLVWLFRLLVALALKRALERMIP